MSKVTSILCLLPCLCFGFELNPQTWTGQVDYYLASNCPAYVHESIEEVIGRLTPFETNFAGFHNAIGFDEKPTVYCSYSKNQALSTLLAWITTDEQYSSGGSATRYWNKNTLEMLDCDIWLNNSVIDPENIEKILGHEWGHCLGLKHENQVLSLMNTDIRFVLSEKPTIDDLAGLELLYGECRPVMDHNGSVYIPRIDPSRVIATLPDYHEWKGDVAYFLTGMLSGNHRIYGVSEPHC